MAKAEQGNGKGYKGIFFTWCVPGLVLVLVGQQAGRVALSFFGMALLSIGIFYYGKIKKHGWWWYTLWLVLFFVYLTFGFVELAQPR